MADIFQQAVPLTQCEKLLAGQHAQADTRPACQRVIGRYAEIELFPADAGKRQTRALRGRAETAIEAPIRDLGLDRRWIVLAHIDLKGRVPVAQVGRFWQTFLVRADAACRAAAMPAPRVGTRMQAASVELIESEATHAGYFVTRTERLRHPTFAGGMSAELDRETFVMGDACVVLPYDPVRDRVLLTEQFRLGPWARGARYPWVLEPVAGRIDPGETPEDCARRECVEEAGAELGELLKVAEYYPSTGGVSEYIYTYIGLCDLPDLPEGGGGMADEGEDIRTHLLSFDQAMDLVSGGEANDGPLILLMLWLQRERPRLRGSA